MGINAKKHFLQTTSYLSNTSKKNVKKPEKSQKMRSETANCQTWVQNTALLSYRRFDNLRVQEFMFNGSKLKKYTPEVKLKHKNKLRREYI